MMMKTRMIGTLAVVVAATVVAVSLCSCSKPADTTAAPAEDKAPPAAEKAAPMEAAKAALQDVDSSVLDKASYDKATKELTLVFDSGETYIYKDVPADINDALMKAESKGKYFYANIRDKFQFEKK
jgi:lysyl-tRNA synthetase class 2